MSHPSLSRIGLSWPHHGKTDHCAVTSVRIILILIGYCHVGKGLLDWPSLLCTITCVLCCYASLTLTSHITHYLVKEDFSLFRFFLALVIILFTIGIISIIHPQWPIPHLFLKWYRWQSGRCISSSNLFHFSYEIMEFLWWT